MHELAVYTAPAGSPVAARTPGSHTPLPVRVLAGVGSSPFVDGPAGGLVLLAVAIDGVEHVRQVAVEAGTPPPPLEPGGRTVVRGTIRDAAAAPLPGARVWLGELLADGQRRTVPTDENGRFELDAPAGEGVPLLAEADGKALQWRALHVEPNTPTEVELQLPDGCTVEVQLAATARDLPLARAYVVPHGAVSSELAQWPFFLQVLDGGAPVDDAGRALLRGLPRSGEVGLVVAHPGAPLAAPQPQRLAGPRVLATVPLRHRELTASRIVDDEGHPVADVLALVLPAGARPPASRSPRLLPPLLEATGALLGWTGADGALHLGPTGPRDVLSLRAPGHAGLDLPLPAGLPEQVVLPRWRGGGEPSLRLALPGPPTAWSSTWNLSGGLRLQHAAGERATVALPHAGRIDVTATTFVGTEKRGERTFRGLDVTGPIDLEAPPQR